MKKVYLVLVYVLMIAGANAQVIPGAQQFGGIDNSDLLLKQCDFEKDAVAEILFDKANFSFNSRFELIIERHKRIKIFSENAKSLGNVAIPYQKLYCELINLQAETINLKGNTPVVTPVDKNQIYVENTDKTHKKTIFAFPDVSAGSILEYKYTITYRGAVDLPTWYFQNTVPTRYSEIRTDIPENVFNYKSLEMVTQPFSVSETKENGVTIKALANVPSLQAEPYMTTLQDNCQRISYQLVAMTTGEAHLRDNFYSWEKVGESVSKSLAWTMEPALANSADIVTTAKKLKTVDKKIAYLFNEIKQTMKWDGYHNLNSYAGLREAWKNRSGNSAEINLILCRLLQRSGVKAYPMLTSTRDNGRVYTAFTNPNQFNTIVAYVPVDTTSAYVLDASKKFNLYNQIPQDFLNSSGLFMDPGNDIYELIFLENAAPVNTVIATNSEIFADGKLKGNAVINNYGYNKIDISEKYTKDGEQKYSEYLKNGDGGMSISALKLEDKDNDVLPLKQTYDFSTQLAGENNYIYVSPNLFAPLKNNPFVSEHRLTDVDFGYRDNYSITGTFKIPAGYKVEALPKSLALQMPDESIICRRFIAEEGGVIVARFVIDHKKSIYFKENYPEFHEFCKKMYEMLNEQIILKKS